MTLRIWSYHTVCAESVNTIFSELRIGDHVRLKTGDDRGAEWTVVGRSFVSMTFDISSEDGNFPGRIMHGVRSELLQRIATAPDQDT